jgi:hypothetical protein
MMLLIHAVWQQWKLWNQQRATDVQLARPMTKRQVR